MSVLMAFSVLDSAVGAFNRPFFLTSRGQAVRSFMDEVAREAPDNAMNRHPGDFSLWHVGHFDEDVGRLIGLEVNERVALASDFFLGKE